MLGNVLESVGGITDLRHYPCPGGAENLGAQLGHAVDLSALKYKVRCKTLSVKKQE